MATDQKIIAAVQRIDDGWNYPMTTGKKVEYEDKLDGLDPKILNAAIDALLETERDRPSIFDVKLAYDKLRPSSMKAGRDKAVTPVDRARAMVNQFRERILSCQALDTIQTLAGKAKFRDHLLAVAFVQAQGACGGMMAGISYDGIAFGYGSWSEDRDITRAVRDQFERGKQHQSPDGSYSAAALRWCRDLPEFENVTKVQEALSGVNIKRMSKDNFNKAQQFGEAS